MSSMWTIPVSRSGWTEIGSNLSGTGTPFTFTCNLDFQLLAVETPVDGAAPQRVPAERARGFFHTANSVIEVDTDTYQAEVTRPGPPVSTADENVREKFYVIVDHNSREDGVVRVWAPHNEAEADADSVDESMVEP